MPTDEAEGPSGGARRGTGRHDVEGETTASEELAFLVGGLLIELGSKIQEAGIDGVRILTEEEAQQSQLRWFREGWAEHARATETAGAADHARATDHESAAAAPAGHGDVEPPPASSGSSASSGSAASSGSSAPPGSSARLFQFPAGPPRGAHPLPIVGRDDARGTRDLMSHRPRRRREDPPKGHPGTDA
ncbi:hypothetical protein ABZ953_08405 [Streptomyces sp. NPDC046465]|uniref:hypothetical protein n=1 Tax=Streptomyces sp. NPDC046465 TaxID=3155810 RepID=UPI0033D91443